MEVLGETYLPLIVDNQRSIEAYEMRKEEIVARALEDLELLRESQTALVEEIAARQESIALLEERVAGRRARLEESDDPAGSQWRRQLEDDLASFENELAQERAALADRQRKSTSAAAEIARLEKADGEALFLDQMQPLYREGIDLHLGFYRGVIELTRQQLPPGEESAMLLDRWHERMSERDRLREQRLSPRAYAALRREFEVDRRLSQAWLAALILEVRFATSEYRLESISEPERRELELLASALEESWAENPFLVMHIDGHADSQRFRGTTACISATRNRELSRQRAEEVRSFFAQRLGGDEERVEMDYFGNFSPLANARLDQLDNRRIELRVSSRRGEDDDAVAGAVAHPDYFSMRNELTLAGRRFIRRPGKWVEEACQERPAARRVDYLSAPYEELVERLGLDAPARIVLTSEDRELEVRLGNAFIVEDGADCVEIRPCPDPEL